ncbi:unnamed protein product [Ostreobium quekettii]|uniref:HMG box domain-containing protein n=1 Tax=Ostreobium quekettii TaxID=121088 RepID=A0A8S1IWD6_9CHLO|nr:unnamed protein product [Ostreobium quekettii]
MVRKVVRTTARRPGGRPGAGPLPAASRRVGAGAKGGPRMQAATAGKKKTPAGRAGGKAKGAGRSQRVRVWWPPTKDKKKTDYSGAYWPAKVIARYEGGCRVEYDNGDTEAVDDENVSPADVPVEFGEETTRLQVREYCEVFNDSPSDPAAWLARIKKVGRGTYTVEFPFHDTSPEVVKEDRVRRARIFETETKKWKAINPNQDWDEGEVTSPVELELLPESELKDALKGKTAKKEEPKLKVSRKGISGVKKVVKPSKPQKPKSKKTGETSRAKAPTPSKAQVVVQEAPQATPAFSVGGGAAPIPAGMQYTQGLQIPPGMVWSGLVPGMRPGSPTMMMMPQTGYTMDAVPETRPPKRKKKDPNAPKKAKSAYIVFMERHRPDLKAEGLENPEIMKRLAEMWHKAAWEEKGDCQKEADKDKERYDSEIKDYKPPPVEPEREVKKRRKDKDAPKKPLSPYILFSKDFREKLDAGVEFTDATRKAAEAWRATDEETRKKYAAKAAELKEDYQKKKVEYKAKKEHESKEAAQRQMMLRTMIPSPGSFALSPSSALTPPQSPLDPQIKEVLSKLDLNKAKVSILRNFTMEAYYLLLDVWRENSPRLGDSIRAYKAHIETRERHDWRAFFVSVFGFEKMHALLRRESATTSDVAKPSQDGAKDEVEGEKTEAVATA